MDRAAALSTRNLPSSSTTAEEQETDQIASIFGLSLQAGESSSSLRERCFEQARSACYARNWELIDRNADIISRIQNRAGQTLFEVAQTDRDDLEPLFHLSGARLLKNTAELAQALRETSPSDPRYLFLQTRAIDILNQFAHRPIKTKPLVREVSALALTRNSDVFQSLIKILIEEIQKSPLLDIDQLKALLLTLENAHIDDLKPNDLVQILKIIADKITNTSKQDTQNLYGLLQLLSGILDAIGDSNAISLDRVEEQDPLYKTLKDLKTHKDLSVASQAAYALQSLVRIPDDASKFSSVLRRLLALGRGVTSLVQVVTQKDPSQITDAYRSFKESVSSKQKRKTWHNEMRCFKLLIAYSRFDAFSTFAKTQAKEIPNPRIAGGVLNLVYDAILENEDPSFRKPAIDFLIEIFSDEKWGSQKGVKRQLKDKVASVVSQTPETFQEAVLKRVISLASHPDDQLRAYVRERLKTPPQNTKTQSELAAKLLPKDIDTLPVRKFNPSDHALSHELFDSVFYKDTAREQFLKRLDHLTRQVENFHSRPDQAINLPGPHPDFVGRQETLENLSRHLIPSSHAPQTYNPRAPATLRILHAPRGMGKSETAIYFANTHTEQFSLIWFFRTQSPEFFDKDYRDLGQKLQIFIEKKTPAEIRALVHNRLEQWDSQKPWLLIYDNVEEELTLPLRGGSLILTTTESHIHQDQNAFIELPPFSLKETTSLQEKIPGLNLPSQDLTALQTTLENRTMLLNLALHYIADTGCTVPAYSSRIQSGSALEESTKRYPHSLRQVVTLSYTHLQQKHPEAFAFFNLIVHLNAAEIPLFLLDHWINTLPSPSPSRPPSPRDKRYRIIKALIGSSLMSHSPITGHLTLHPLTQLVCQKEPQPQETFNKTLKLLVQACGTFDSKTPSSWGKGEVAALQIDTLIRNPLWPSGDSALQGELFSIAGNWLTHVKANADRGLEHHRKALEIYEALKDEPLIARSYYNIGVTLANLGRSSEALEEHKKALAIRLRYHDKAPHLDLALSYNNIGINLQGLRRPSEALEAYEKALEIFPKCYGDVSYPYEALIYTNIGLSLESLLQHSKALEEHRKAVEILLKFYHEVPHPDVALIYSNIGLSLESLKRYPEALEEYRKGLAIALKYYGDAPHPLVAIIYNNMAGLLRILGQHSEALEEQRKALAIQLKCYGDAPHPNVALSYNNIGVVLEKLGQRSEALEEHKKSLEIRRRCYGEVPHPDVATSHNNIGSCLQSLGRSSEALGELKKALDISVKCCDETSDPDVALIYNNTGAVLRKLGRYSEALEEYRKALLIWVKCYEKDPHPLLALGYNNIGACLLDLRRYSEALEEYRKALPVLLKCYREVPHSDVAEVYNNIGCCLQLLGRHSEAVGNYEKAFDIYKKTLGESNPRTQLSLALLNKCKEKVEDCTIS